MHPEIVLGPPGCGKTTTLLNAVDTELRRGVPPDRIAYLSFTRRAAEEAVTRACAKFKLSRDDLPHFRTLHSLAFKALGLASNQVFAGQHIRAFAEWADLPLTTHGWDEDGQFVGYLPGDRILFMENLARIKGVPLRQVYDLDDDGLAWDEVERAATALRQFKSDEGLYDFTDMLDTFTAKCPPVPLDVLVVDEVQDLSFLQWAMVRKLAAGVPRVVVAGDDDQAIYRWAGADVDVLVGLEGDARVLGQSYRVPVAVQALAGEIINGVQHRRPKEWMARAEPGEVLQVAQVDDVDWTGGWEELVQPILVLARNTYILQEQVEPALRAAGVLYEWGEKPSLSPSVTSAIVAWERLRRDEPVTAELVRGVYRMMTPDRGVAHAGRSLAGVPDDAALTLTDLERDHGLLTRAIWHEALDRLPPDDVGYIIEALKRGERLGKPRVRLSTIHGAKGGEARHVVLMTEMAPRTFAEMERSPDDERRVWYVGVTRARERLTVVESSRREACPWV